LKQTAQALPPAAQILRTDCIRPTFNQTQHAPKCYVEIDLEPIG